MGRLAKIFVRFLPGRCPVGSLPAHFIDSLIRFDTSFTAFVNHLSPGCLMSLTFVYGFVMVFEMRRTFWALLCHRRGHLLAVQACQQRLAEAAVLLHPCLDVQSFSLQQSKTAVWRRHTCDIHKSLPASNQLLRAELRRKGGWQSAPHLHLLGSKDAVSLCPKIFRKEVANGTTMCPSSSVGKIDARFRWIPRSRFVLVFPQISDLPKLSHVLDTWWLAKHFASWRACWVEGDGSKTLCSRRKGGCRWFKSLMIIDVFWRIFFVPSRAGMASSQAQGTIIYNLKMIWESKLR